MLWLYVIGVAAFVITALSQLGKLSARVLVLLSMTVICSSIAIDMNFYAMFGWFGTQGRHIAPILVGVPLHITTQSSVRNR